MITPIPASPGLPREAPSVNTLSLANNYAVIVSSAINILPQDSHA